MVSQQAIIMNLEQKNKAYLKAPIAKADFVYTFDNYFIHEAAFYLRPWTAREINILTALR